AQGVEQGGAHDAHDLRALHHRQGDHGQDQVLDGVHEHVEAAVQERVDGEHLGVVTEVRVARQLGDVPDGDATRLQPAEPAVEDDQQPDTEHERGQGPAHDGHDPRDLVDELIAVQCGGRAHPDADAYDGDDGEQRQLQCGGEAIDDGLDDRLAADARVTEVALHDLADPAAVLQVPRVVEPVERDDLVEPVHLLLRLDVRARPLIGGEQLHEQLESQRDADEHYRQ